MTIYTWKVTSGNFGAASSWNPTGTPTSSDATNIGVSTSLFGSGSASTLVFFDDIIVTISAALTTDIADYVVIGTNSALATVDVDAAWTDTSGITIGGNPSGNGAIVVNAGGSLNTSSLAIGTAYNTGAGGTGAMTVDGGGIVKTTGTWDNVGDHEGATGTLTVTGTGSSWTSGGTLNIGDNGTGTLYVENGATLNAVQLNNGVSYDQDDLASGSGTTFIESGGVVTTTSNYQEIGNGAYGDRYITEGATGAVTVTGAGSKWIATNGAIEIGDSGSKSGSLTISDGGNVTATNEFDVGTQSGTNSANGAYDGSFGTLLIETGGTAVTGGYLNGSNGRYYDTVGSNFSTAHTSTATVTGSGSSWRMSANLSIHTSGQVFAASGGTIEAMDGMDVYGDGLLKVDASGTVEDGSVGGAALGYLTVDPVAPGGSSNFDGNGTVDANLVNNGKIYAGDGGTDAFYSPGALTFNGANGGFGTISGTGLFFVGTQATLVLNSSSVASSLAVKFDGWDATLAINSSGFDASIRNFDAGDTIDIHGFTYSSGSSSYTFTPNGSNGGGVLLVKEGPGSVTLDIASSPQSISGNLTLSEDSSGNGTDVTFTNGAAQSPFNEWLSLGSFFNTTSGVVNGEDYQISNATDGGAPIWTETETPAASFAPGADNYTIVLATQDWLGDIQPEMTIATDSDFVDPFVTTNPSTGNLASALIFSSNSAQGTGGVIYWTKSTTSDEYAVDFEPLTVAYPSAPATANLVTISGSPVTMISAIASPMTWQVSSENSSSMVFAYEAAASSTTENLYMEGFNTSGDATNSGPVLIASDLPNGTPYYIGYNSSGYGYRYLEVGGALGTGLVAGTFDTTTGALGTASLFLSLPNFTAFNGISSFSISDGNSLRFIEGVDNGQTVIQTFLNGNSTPQATFALSAIDDHFQTTSVYDINSGQMDYIALAYTDAGKVHLELLNENGQQIGGDYIVPGISSFLRLHTMNGSSNNSSTRVELDYAVADPNGGQEIEGFIFDTAGDPYNVQLSGGGLYDGSPFDDTFTWAEGVYTIDGGGGVDTLSATNLSASQVTLKIDSTGETIVNDGAGDVDTLRRFTYVDLSNATVTISGNTLTQNNSDGSKAVSTFNITGQAFTSKVISYAPNGQVVSKLFEDVTGEGNLTSFKYLYAGNNLIGTDDYYTGIADQSYNAEEVDYNGAGQLVRIALSGVSGAPYSSYQYDYVGGVFAGSQFNYTQVPEGATYSSYEVDYNQAGALLGDKFFFTGLSGLGYTTEEADFNASGKPSRVVLSGVTGQSYYQLEEDYNAGVYEGYKAYYQITGEPYTTEEVDVSNSNQIEKVVYSGMTSTPYSSVEEDYANGSLTQIVYGYAEVTGATYNAYQVFETAAGGGLSEVFDLNSGGHTQIALASGQTLTSQGNDKFTGSSTGSTTFVLDPIYGADTITNLTSADIVSMSSAEFANFSDLQAAAVQSSANVVITAADHDTLTLKNMTLSTLAGLSGNFTFNP